MRAPGMVATAVRRADGSIVVRKEPFVSFSEKYRVLRLPVLRGALGLAEMLIVGIRTLNFSAEIALKDVEQTEGRGDGESGRRGDGGGWKLGVTGACAFVIGVAVFFITPLLVTTSLFSVEQEPVRFNLIAGGMRVILLLAYLGLISLMKDVKRLFQYHGAEHKAVYAFEAGELLTLPAAMAQTRFHPRCGTSFLLVVMVVAILLFSLFDAVVIQWLGHINVVLRIATHIPLLPFVAGVSYEFIKASARHSTTAFGRLIVAPGLWLQKITTKEPDQHQVEVALTALRAALGEDDGRTSARYLNLLQEISVN